MDAYAASVQMLRAKAKMKPLSGPLRYGILLFSTAILTLIPVLIYRYERDLDAVTTNGISQTTAFWSAFILIFLLIALPWLLRRELTKRFTFQPSTRLSSSLIFCITSGLAAAVALIYTFPVLAWSPLGTSSNALALISIGVLGIGMPLIFWRNYITLAPVTKENAIYARLLFLMQFLSSLYFLLNIYWSN